MSPFLSDKNVLRFFDPFSFFYPISIFFIAFQTDFGFVFWSLSRHHYIISSALQRNFLRKHLKRIACIVCMICLHPILSFFKDTSFILALSQQKETRSFFSLQRLKGCVRPRLECVRHILICINLALAMTDVVCQCQIVCHILDVPVGFSFFERLNLLTLHNRNQQSACSVFFLDSLK